MGRTTTRRLEEESNLLNFLSLAAVLAAQEAAGPIRQSRCYNMDCTTFVLSDKPVEADKEYVVLDPVCIKMLRERKEHARAAGQLSGCSDYNRVKMAAIVSADGVLLAPVFLVRGLAAGVAFDPAVHNHTITKVAGNVSGHILLLPPTTEFPDERVFEYIISEIFVPKAVERRIVESAASPVRSASASGIKYSERITLSLDGEIAQVGSIAIAQGLLDGWMD